MTGTSYKRIKTVHRDGTPIVRLYYSEKHDQYMVQFLNRLGECEDQLYPGDRERANELIDGWCKVIDDRRGKQHEDI